MGRLFSERRDNSTGWIPAPIVPPFPGADWTGRPSIANRPDSALVDPTVFACVKLVADTVSCMRLETFRKTDTVPARITDPSIVATPDSTTTQSVWMHQLVASLCLRGNGYGLITARDQMFRPTNIMMLNPDMVTVRINNDTGAVRYFVGRQQVDRTPDMFHVPGMQLPGNPVGLSPVAYAAATIGIDLASQKFAKDFYEGGGVPKAVLTTKMPVDLEQAKTLKDRLKAATTNREPVVLSDDVQYQQISVKPEESQFLATQQFNIAQISRFFGVPAEMVGGTSGSSLTYTTVELNSLNFLTYGIGWLLRRIEDAFFTILPQPQYVQFNVSNLLRSDLHTQAQIDAINVAAKISPPSRILAARNEPPLTDAEKDELELVPLTVTPNGMPKALPNPGTPLTSDDTPDVAPGKPKLGVVANA